MSDSIKSAISINTSDDDVIYINTVQKKYRIRKEIANSICDAFVRIHRTKNITARKQYAQFLSDIEGDICVEVTESYNSEATVKFEEIPNKPSTTAPIQDVTNTNPDIDSDVEPIDRIIAAAKNSNTSDEKTSVSKDVQPSVEQIPDVNNYNPGYSCRENPSVDSMDVSNDVKPSVEPIVPIIGAVKNSNPGNTSDEKPSDSNDVQPSVEPSITIVNNSNLGYSSDEKPSVDSMDASNDVRPSVEPNDPIIAAVKNPKPGHNFDQQPLVDSKVVSNDEQSPVEPIKSAIQVNDTDESMKQGIQVDCNDAQPSVVSVKTQNIGENPATSLIRSEEVTDIKEDSTDLKIIISLVTVTDPVLVSTPITHETVDNPPSDEPIAAPVEAKISTSITERSEQMDDESLSDILQQALIDSNAIGIDEIAVNAEDHLINDLRTSEAATSLKINFLIHCLYRDNLHKHRNILKFNGLDNQSKVIHNKYLKDNLDKNNAFFDQVIKQSANKIRTNYLNLSPNNQISFCTSVISDIVNMCANANISFDSRDCPWLHSLIVDEADNNIELLETIAQEACFKDKHKEIYRIHHNLQEDRVFLDCNLINVQRREEELLQREQQNQVQQEQLQLERQLVRQQSEQLSQILQRPSHQTEILQRQLQQQSPMQLSQQVPKQCLRPRSLAEMLRNVEPSSAYGQPPMAGQIENQNRNFAMHQQGRSAEPLRPPFGQHATVQSRQTQPFLYRAANNQPLNMLPLMYTSQYMQSPAPGSNGINDGIVGNGGEITANLQQRLSTGQNRPSPLQSPMQQQQVVQQQMQSSQQLQQSQQQQQQIQLQQQRQSQQLQNQQILINTANQSSNFINNMHPNQLQDLPSQWHSPNPSHAHATPSLSEQLQRHSNFGITYSHPDYPPSFPNKRPSSTVLSPELCSSTKRIATTGVDQLDAPRSAQMTSPQSVAPPPPYTPHTLSQAGVGPNTKDVPKKPMQRRHSIYQERNIPVYAEGPVALPMHPPQNPQPGPSSAPTQFQMGADPQLKKVAKKPMQKRHSVYQETVYAEGPIAIHMFLPQYPSSQYQACQDLKNADVPKKKRAYNKKNKNPPQIAQLGTNSAPALVGADPKLRPNMAKKPMKRRHSVYQEPTIPVYAEGPIALPMHPPQNPQPGPSSAQFQAGADQKLKPNMAKKPMQRRHSVYQEPTIPVHAECPVALPMHPPQNPQHGPSSAPSIHSSRQPQRRNSVYHVMPPSHTGVQPPIRPTSKIYELAELQGPNRD